VFFGQFEFSFGLIAYHSLPRESIKEMDKNVRKFVKTKGKAIFCFFIGLVNHWVTVIVHKTQNEKLEFYFLDS
jgi:hypothetical protein